MSLDPRLSPEEQAVAQAAVDAGFVTPGELELAIAARDAQRRAGQPITLLPILAQRLRPDQLAHLRGVHQRGTGRLGPPVGQQPGSGKRLGRYAVIRELGVGGMGAVYLAQDPELDRRVAVKVVLPGADAETIERTRVEAQASSRLDHPGIVKLHTVERDANNRLLIALEVIEGGSLSDRLKREGPLPPREAVELMVQVARAMQYAHDRGVLHRDLKPANILLTEDGRPKVTDFGLAKHQDDDQGLTKTGVIMGSPGYMAPEQAAAERNRIDHRADVYGLGATLFALLTGRPPFQGSLVSIISSLLTKEAPTARSINPDVDPSLSAICASALAREPEDRIQSAGELAEELQGYLAGEAHAPRRLWPIPLLVGVLVIAAAVVFRPQTPALPATQPSASASASPSPDPVASKPPVDPSDPSGWPARIELDGEALRSEALPHLEVWGTRLVETDRRGIRLRCTAPNTTELLLPLEYSGGPFRLELTGRIAQLEDRNRLSLTFHHWPNDKNRRALSGVPAKERGPEWPRFAASIHGVRRASTLPQEDVVWVPGFYPGYGTRRPKEPRWERSPAAPLTLTLTYEPKRCAFELELRVGDHPPYRLAEHLPQPLESGSYRLRLGVNLRPRHGKKAVSYNAVLRGRSSTFRPSGSVCDVGGLRLVLRAPKADTATLTVSPPHTIRAEVGRLLRAVWARRDLEATANALGSIASGSAAGHEETPHYSEMAAARYGLAHLHELNGKPVEAAKLYKALDYGFEMQDQQKQKPRITYWIHRAWVRELLTADEGRLLALQRAHALLQLKKTTVKDRVAGLFRRPGSTPISNEQLLLTGMQTPPGVDVGLTAKRLEGYLARYRAAELLVLTTGRPDLCTPAARGEIWYALGNMQRALDLIGGGALDRTGASLTARAAFRLARWRACVDVLERHPAAQALKPGRQLLERARQRLKDG